MILDAIRPYLTAIRIAGYIAIIGFLLVSGCNYGKQKQAIKVAELETALGVCRDANNSNADTIKRLEDANALYAAESEKQAKDVAEAQESLERAQKRIQAQEKAFNKELDRAYKKNPSWADGAVPADVKRVFDRAD